MSAQFFEKARAVFPDLDEQFARGEFTPLREWLTGNIYRHGRKFTAPELVRRVTGSDIAIEPYIAYLRGKYGALYSL